VPRRIGSEVGWQVGDPALPGSGRIETYTPEQIDRVLDVNLRAGIMLTHALLPGISRLFGYFPAAALGQGENIPAGVAIEWASWCRDPDYLVGALGAKEQYARFSAPLRLYWVADDPYAPLAAAEALLELYPRAPSELTRVMPRELGAERIGHFGFFREQFRDTLWRDAADWLERH